MTPRHWVIGAGGLLGSAVSRSIAKRGGEIFRGEPIDWTSDAASKRLAGQIDRFVEQASSGWRIYWCAGGGVTSTRAAVLDREVAMFDHFTTELQAALRRADTRGVLFLASSVGAVYGGSSGAPFSERTAEVPLGAYGRSKLQLEEVARNLATDDGGVAVAIGRIANLYGPGQSLSKQQGLLSRLCIAALTNTAMPIFVPLDTQRDYLYVDDAAELVIDFTERARTAAGPGPYTKIIASGRTLSVGAMLGEFRRVSGTRPPVLMSSLPASALQALDLRVRSDVWPELDRRPLVPLPDGIGRTMASLRAMLRDNSILTLNG